MAAAGPILMAAGGLTSAYGQLKAGNDANDAYNEAADIADDNAKKVLFASAEEQRRLRVIGRKAAGDITASYGASGVKMEGSALDVLAENNANIERDVESIRLEGKNRADNFNRDARLKRGAGRAARESGQIGAVGALLGAGASGFEAYGKVP